MMRECCLVRIALSYTKYLSTALLCRSQVYVQTGDPPYGSALGVDNIPRSSFLAMCYPGSKPIFIKRLPFTLSPELQIHISNFRND